jgi:hypothetical protein
MFKTDGISFDAHGRVSLECFVRQVQLKLGQEPVVCWHFSSELAFSNYDKD